MQSRGNSPKIVIACGGTGGHLFPGLAMADAFESHGCDVLLLISQKEIDQLAMNSASGFEYFALPAVPWTGGDLAGMVHGFWRSFRACAELFRPPEPRAVLATGGFTTAPAILAAKMIGIPAFLHESNSIPGRANRWLAPWTDAVFTWFSEAGRRLSYAQVFSTGTPVRAQMEPMEAAACRTALGLDTEHPVVLVMGGSQGALAINQLLKQALPILSQSSPELQFIHLTGLHEKEDFAALYRQHQHRAIVRPFLTEMELALGAATVAVSRAGASTLAEFAALQVPSILIPYPSAADNHQFFNARAFTRTGAARQMDQASATAEMLARNILDLTRNASLRDPMKAALRQWHAPDAADQIARAVMNYVRASERRPPAAAKGAGESPLMAGQ